MGSSHGTGGAYQLALRRQVIHSATPRLAVSYRSVICSSSSCHYCFRNALGSKFYDKFY